MKRLAMCIVMVLPVLYHVTASAEPVYQGLALSGQATTALAHAYDAAGFKGDTPSPFRLRPYVVTIYSDRTTFLVEFLSETTQAHESVIVSAITGAIIWKTGETKNETALAQNWTLGAILPGIMTGEIIVFYEQARKDKYAPLASGNYSIDFEPRAAGASVAFSKVKAPRTASLLMPTMDPNCHTMPGCFTGPHYFVDVLNNVVSIGEPVKI